MIYRFYSSPEHKNRVAVIGEYAEGQLTLAVSRCSDKDNFVRKKGRFIAEGRLKKGKIYGIVTIPKPTTEDFLKIAGRIAGWVEASKESVPQKPYII